VVVYRDPGSTLKILKTKVMHKLGLKPLYQPACLAKATLDSDEYWICRIKKYGETNYHPVGTNEMGRPADGVVDTKFRLGHLP